MRGGKSKTMTQEEQLDRSHQINKSVYNRVNDGAATSTKVLAKNSGNNLKSPTKLQQTEPKIKQSNKSAIGKTSASANVKSPKIELERSSRKNHNRKSVQRNRPTVGNTVVRDNSSANDKDKAAEMTVVTIPNSNENLRESKRSGSADSTKNASVESMRLSDRVEAGEDSIKFCIDEKISTSISTDLRSDGANSGSSPRNENNDSIEVTEKNTSAEDHSQVHQDDKDSGNNAEKELQTTIKANKKMSSPVSEPRRSFSEKDHVDKDKVRTTGKDVASSDMTQSIAPIKPGSCVQPLPKTDDPIVRLNALRANISNALKEVKAVLDKHAPSVEANDEKQDANEEGVVNFRFVRRVRKKSVINFEDVDVICNPPVEETSKTHQADTKISNNKTDITPDSCTGKHVCEATVGDISNEKCDLPGKETAHNGDPGPSCEIHGVKPMAASDNKKTAMKLSSNGKQDMAKMNGIKNEKLIMDALDPTTKSDKLAKKDIQPKELRCLEEKQSKKSVDVGDKSLKEETSRESTNMPKDEKAATNTRKDIADQHVPIESKKPATIANQPLPDKKAQGALKKTTPKSAAIKNVDTSPKKDSVKLKKVSDKRKNEGNKNENTEVPEASEAKCHINGETNRSVCTKKIEERKVSSPKTKLSSKPLNNPEVEAKKSVTSLEISNVQQTESISPCNHTPTGSLPRQSSQPENQQNTLQPSTEARVQKTMINDTSKMVVKHGISPKSNTQSVKKQPTKSHVDVEVEAKKTLNMANKTIQPEKPSHESSLNGSSLNSVGIESMANAEAKCSLDNSSPSENKTSMTLNHIDITTTKSLPSTDSKYTNQRDESNAEKSSSERKTVSAGKEEGVKEHITKIPAVTRAKRGSLTESTRKKFESLSLKRASIGSESDIIKIVAKLEEETTPEISEKERKLKAKSAENDRASSVSQVSFASEGTSTAKTTRTTATHSAETADATANSNNAEPNVSANSIAAPKVSFSAAPSVESSVEILPTLLCIANATIAQPIPIEHSTDAKIDTALSENSLDIVKQLISSPDKLVSSESVGLSAKTSAAESASEMTVVKKDNITKPNIASKQSLKELNEKVKDSDLSSEPRKNDLDVFTKIIIGQKIEDVKTISDNDQPAVKIEPVIKNNVEISPSETKIISTEAVKQISDIPESGKSEPLIELPPSKEIETRRPPVKPSLKRQVSVDINVPETGKPIESNSTSRNLSGEKPSEEDLKTAVPENALKEQTSENVDCKVIDTVSDSAATAGENQVKLHEIFVKSSESDSESVKSPTTKKTRKTKKVVIRRVKRKLSRDGSLEEKVEPEVSEKAIAEAAAAQQAEAEAASKVEEEEPVVEEPPIPKGPKSCLVRRSYDPGDVVMYADRVKKSVKWKKATVVEKITDISYKLDIDGDEKPAHISYIKKFTDKKVQFGAKEYLEIDYVQYESSSEEEEYNIWARV